MEEKTGNQAEQQHKSESTDDLRPHSGGPLIAAAALDALTAALIIIGLGLGISSPFLLFRRNKPFL